MLAAKIMTATTALALCATAARADLAISNELTQNVSCSAGVCTATAQKAVLNTGDLATMLAGGDVAVKTGGGATNIVVKAGFGWTNTSQLTLDANQSVEIEQPVSVTGTGAVTITTNDGGSGGDLTFDGKGNIKFWDTGSSLVINGKSYTLVKDIATLASDIATNPSGFYALANSIDVKGETFSRAAIGTDFSGTFEGLGQAVSHLKIKKHDHNGREGFFAHVEIPGVVRDLTLKKVNIHASGDINVGALVGVNEGALVNISVDGELQSTAQVTGGVVGENSGTLANVASAVDVTSGLVAGGVVGASIAGSITRSHATGSVAGLAAGGLAGSGSNISLSYATGSVTGSEGAGGLVDGGDHIDQCYATGAVTSADKSLVGGLAGHASFINNSYATGDVQGGTDTNSRIGGLVGYAMSISTSYSVGHVAGGSGSAVGGLFGKGDRKSIEDYWDTDTSGTTVGCAEGDCPGVTGLTTEQLQSALPAGFDPAIWSETASINGGLPYLLALPPPN